MKIRIPITKQTFCRLRQSTKFLSSVKTPVGRETTYPGPQQTTVVKRTLPAVQLDNSTFWPVMLNLWIEKRNRWSEIIDYHVSRGNHGAANEALMYWYDADRHIDSCRDAMRIGA